MYRYLKQTSAHRLILPMKIIYQKAFEKASKTNAFESAKKEGIPLAFGELGQNLISIRGQTGIPSNNSISHNEAESKSNKNRICSPAI